MMSAVAVLLALLLVFSSIGSSAGCLVWDGVGNVCPTGSDAGVSNCNRLEVRGECTTTSEVMSQSMPFPGCAAPAVRVSTRSSCLVDSFLGCVDWQYFSTCSANCPAVVTDKCVECNAGFELQSDGSCVGCGAGSGPGSPFGSPCATCSLSTYKAHISGPDGINCIPVPVGSYRVSASAISLCDEGYTCAGGAAAKVKCHNADTPSGSATCTNCLASTYPVGVEGTASATCDTCPKGFACSGKTEVTQSAPTKIACDDAGEWAAATGALACAPVPAGSYKKLQAGAETPSFLTVSGADVNSIVEPCSTGYACAGGAARPVKCHNENTVGGSATCTNCLAKTYPTESGLAADLRIVLLHELLDPTKAICKQCEPGFECPDGVSRQLCPSGKYAHSASSPICYPIVAGFHRISASVAEPCQLGHKCDGGSAPPDSCPVGRFASSRGANACNACPDGTFTELTGRPICDACPTSRATCENGRLLLPEKTWYVQRCQTSFQNLFFVSFLTGFSQLMYCCILVQVLPER